MSRRGDIAMSGEEASAFLQEGRTVTCATIGRDGWPHLMPLWYVVRPGGALWAWTYAKSQKVLNLRRDPRCTLQVEAGTEYRQLRGIMLACEAAVHDEIDVVAGLGAELAGRYSGARLDREQQAALRRQAAKRVGLEFIERRRVTWDHRKLGGTP